MESEIVMFNGGCLEIEVNLWPYLEQISNLIDRDKV